jgi:hypothetical protein
MYLRAMVKLFLGNRTGVLLLIPFFMLGYFLLDQFTGYYPHNAETNSGMWGTSIPLTDSFLEISGAILVVINALAINMIYNANEFLERNSYMPSLLYVVMMSFYHATYSIDGLLVAHSFVIAMIYQLFLLRQNEDGRKRMFNGAFLAGCATTFHPPLVLLAPLLIIMARRIRPFVFREALLVILGMAIPLVYAGVYLWLSGSTIELKLIDKSTDYLSKQTDFLITSVLFTLLFLLSLASISSRMKTASIRLKKLTSMLWWLVLLGSIFGVADFFAFGQIERFSFLMIPLSFFLPFSFASQTFGGLATVLFYITFGYSCLKFFL